jgi:hypothetical protein
LNDLEQVSEGCGVGRSWVNEEDGRGSRTWTRGGIDYVEASLLQAGERCMDIGDAKGDVGEAAASTVLCQLPGDRRFGTERLQQLDAIRAVSDLEENFADLVGAEDLFAVEFVEAHEFVGFQIAVEVARRDRDGDMVDAEEAWQMLRDCIHSQCSDEALPMRAFFGSILSGGAGRYTDSCE